MTPPAYSRPFRSLTVFLVCWVMMRALTLWSGEIVESDLRAAPIGAVRMEAKPIRPAMPFASLQAPTRNLSPKADSVDARRSMPVRRLFGHSPFAASDRAPRAAAGDQVFRSPPAAIEIADRAGAAASALPSIPARAEPSPATPSVARTRWSGSAWLLARRDGPNGLGTAGELGGSQAGMRIFHDIDRTVAATARISRALSRAQGGEASVGVAIRHRNIGLLLERRVALDRGGRNEFAATAHGGFSDISVDRDMRLDGYAQAGIVGKDKFVDGAIRVEQTVAAVAQTRVSVGAGLWGGAQPDVARLDIGPQIVARIPVIDRTMRLSAEWRERIAGDAAPRSGPSMTIGIDL